MEAKEEIRSKLNIEDVVGEYVELRRAGRNFKGLSPFTNEKTPSFMVSPDKHIWHDFSSNKGGDVFAFIMEVEGIDFRGAMEILARKAGVDLTQFQYKGDKSLSKKKEKLFGLLELATKFYQKSLVSNKSALEYVFKKRNLSKEVAQVFRIGYSPNTGSALYDFLLRKGYKKEDVRGAGLLAERRGRPGDMFRGRMMVPLSDGQGRVVGFTARLVEDVPNAPKYINTPQTLLYDKGRQVFGLHLAKDAIRKTDFAVVVEGNLDVVASHQAKVTQVVATAGTAMTDFHLRSLSRLTGNIRLAFDRDQAGIAATERAIEIASKLGLQLGIVSVPDGFKDPDELIQDDPEKWLAVCNEPQDAVEWLVDEYAKRFDLSSAEGKRVVTTKALKVINQLNDPVEQEHYLIFLTKKTGASLEAIKAKMHNVKDGTVERKLKETKAISSNVDDSSYQDKMLALALFYPSLREGLNELRADDFIGGVRQSIFNIIKKLDNRSWTDDLLDRLQSDDICVKIKELSLIIESEELYATLSDQLRIEMASYEKKIRRDKMQRQKNILAKKLLETLDEQEQYELNSNLRKLTKEIENLKG